MEFSLMCGEAAVQTTTAKIRRRGTCLVHSGETTVLGDQTLEKVGYVAILLVVRS